MARKGIFKSAEAKGLIQGQSLHERKRVLSRLLGTLNAATQMDVNGDLEVGAPTANKEENDWSIGKIKYRFLDMSHLWPDEEQPVNLPLDLDFLPEALKQLRIEPALTSDPQLLSTMQKQKQDLYFSMRITLGDDRDKYVNPDEYGRCRIKEVGDMFEDVMQEGLEVPIEIAISFKRSKNASLESKERIHDATASPIRYYRLGTIETGTESAESLAEARQQEIRTEWILLGYYLDSKKRDLRLAKVKAWHINNKLIGDCERAEPVTRLSKAMKLDQRYEMAGGLKPELQTLLDAAIENDKGGLKKEVPQLPWYTFNAYQRPKSGRKGKAREVHLLVRVINFAGTETVCPGGIVLTLGEHEQGNDLLGAFKIALLQHSKTGALSPLLVAVLRRDDWEEKEGKVVWVLARDSKMYRFVDGPVAQFLDAAGEALYVEVHLLPVNNDEAGAESKRKRVKRTLD